MTLYRHISDVDDNIIGWNERSVIEAPTSSERAYTIVIANLQHIEFPARAEAKQLSVFVARVPLSECDPVWELKMTPQQ